MNIFFIKLYACRVNTRPEYGGEGIKMRKKQLLEAPLNRELRAQIKKWHEPENAFLPPQAVKKVRQ